VNSCVCTRCSLWVTFSTCYQTLIQLMLDVNSWKVVKRMTKQYYPSCKEWVVMENPKISSCVKRCSHNDPIAQLQRMSTIRSKLNPQIFCQHWDSKVGIFQKWCQHYDVIVGHETRTTLWSNVACQKMH
jgi:hypothetical protein